MQHEDPFWKYFLNKVLFLGHPSWGEIAISVLFWSAVIALFIFANILWNMLRVTGGYHG